MKITAIEWGNALPAGAQCKNLKQRCLRLTLTLEPNGAEEEDGWRKMYVFVTHADSTESDTYEVYSVIENKLTLPAPDLVREAQALSVKRAQEVLVSFLHHFLPGCG